MSDSDKEDPMRTHATSSGYIVGNRRPPRDSQFKKGQSGNPKGRPRGSKNLATLLNSALQQKVTVVLPEVRKTANIQPSSGVIRGIPA